MTPDPIPIPNDPGHSYCPICGEPLCDDIDKCPDHNLCPDWDFWEHMKVNHPDHLLGRVGP